MKKMKSHIISIVAVSAALLWGCTNEPVSDDNRIKIKGGFYYMPTDFSATTRGTSSDTSGVLYPSSTTTLPELFPISLVRIDQNIDDTFPSYTNLAELTATMDNPDASNNYLRDVSFDVAQFYKSSSESIKYVGWYPRGTFASDATATTVTQPIDGKTDILLSNEVMGSLGKEFETMLMQHKLCLYRIYVYTMSQVNGVDEETGEPIAGWGDLVDITMSDTPASCTFTLPGTVTYDYANTRNISLKDTPGIYFNGGELPVGFANKRLVGYLMAAPPQDGLLDLDITTSIASASQSISIARNFRSGYAYDVVLCFSNHGIINAEISVDEWVNFGFVPIGVEADIYFNLSRYGTANCYTVSSANTGYCFLGNVKGNGNGSVVGVADTSLNPMYIDVLWESTPGLIELRSHTLSDGFVSFFVPGETLANGKPNKDKLNLTQEGSVIIAAYDQRAGNIIWTWHIWITDRPKEQGYVNGYSALDRNLGATSSKQADGAATYGFYYQWGRKDPLIPSDASYSASASTADITTTVRNPFTLYGATSGVTDWNSAPSNRLWGFVDESQEFQKTIYDPCPVGYRVPESRTWGKISGYEQSTLGLFAIYTLSIWYPGAGYINNVSGLQSGGIYNACCQSQSPFNQNIYHFEYNSVNKKAVIGDNSSFNHTKAFAYPVRCISTDVKTVVTELSKQQTANSYVVSTDGYYKFNATVRGNGADKIYYSDTHNVQDISDGIDASISTSSISKVDILWWQGALDGSYNTTAGIPIEMVTTVPDGEGNVTFLVNLKDNVFVEGNAIVAAFDSSNNILWSWHIWLTDEPALVATGGFTIMDRNLGATYAPTVSETLTSASRLASYGFYYQWGRKDPFPGPPAYNSGTLYNTNSSTWYYKNPSTGSWTTYTALRTIGAASAVSTLAVAAENPTTFYSEVSTSNVVWYPNLIDKVRQSLWGYCVESQAGEGQSQSKTMFDPCPPGYIVCLHKLWGRAHLAGDEEGIGTKALYLTNGTNGQFFPTSNNLWYNTNRTSQGSMVIGDSWYPFNGFRNPDNGRVNEAGTSATSYTGLPMSSAGHCRSYYMTTNASYTTYREGYQEQKSPAFGRAVRCQKQ